MRQKYIYTGLFVFLILTTALCSCKKQDSFLNDKPIGSLSAISTISDVQNILNDENVFNQYASPGVGELSTDDFYITSQFTAFLSPSEYNAYTFATNIYSSTDQVGDWNFPYNCIYYANVVLDALPHISGNSDEINKAKGQALFYRGYSFYNLVQTFSLPYDSSTASSNLGIPLRLTSNLNVKSIRNSQKECFKQIFSDVYNALELLPISSDYTTRPNKVACYGLLARVYLAISNYDSAFLYSTKALSIKSNLVDYNTLNPVGFTLADVNTWFPFPEDIYHSTLENLASITSFSYAVVDSNLYALYDDSDLRKADYFAPRSGLLRFRGSYDLKIFGAKYDGIATDELFLIKAECEARFGQNQQALNDINELLVNRYKTGTFNPYFSSNSDSILNKVLIERRKELLFRGLRWTDLRRLNKDPRFAVPVIRVINGQTYTLQPNDPKYAIQIPYTETSLSGIEDNAR